MNILVVNASWVHDAKGNSLEEILGSLGMRVFVREGQMEKMQMLLVAGKVNPSLRYLLAMANSQDKPILWIVNDSSDFKEAEKLIEKVSQAKVIFLQPDTLQKTLVQFFSEHATIDEKPNIKFTLRITPAMDKYLQWKSKQTGLSKADFLRESIKAEIINKDEDYKGN